MLGPTVGDPMRTYDVWYRREQDGRAPEFAFLDVDYQYAGEIQAASLRDLLVKLGDTTVEDPDLEGQRAIQVGDVAREDSGPYSIFTPTGIWASVQVFDGPIDQT
jgi:hypothetical protein